MVLFSSADCTEIERKSSPALQFQSTSEHRLGQDSIHRRGQNYHKINTVMRNKIVSPRGLRSVLHLSVISINMYSARIQPSL
jgi:hypothetical protein